MKDRFLKYNAQVPRYTSYPTAVHFQPMNAADYAGALGRLPNDARGSLYIHVPFCKEMCWYCGCHTTATRKYAPVEDYISLLLREIRMTAEALPHRLTVSHLHFGGGSPSMLQPDDFRRIMETLRDCFDFAPDAELGLEADPRGITHDKVEAYQECGINRASFGLQDFAPHVQAAINRVQSYVTVEKAANLLRQFGINHLNFDLMYGLPKQTLGDVEDSIGKALALQPDRIAFFGYAHVPWMKKHMRLIRDEDLPDASLRFDQFLLGEKLLTAAGFIPVGLDHFVRAGDSMHEMLLAKKLVRNFQGYTTDQAQVMLGFGMSSIGQLPEGFFQNFPNITEYSAAILDKKLPVCRGRLITDEDRLRAKVISELMCYLEVDVGAVLAEFGRPQDHFSPVLADLEDLAADGLVTVEGLHVRVNMEVRQSVRLVAARFDAYFDAGKNKHAQAV